MLAPERWLKRGWRTFVLNAGAFLGATLILALGAGWFRTECKAYGIEWKPYAKRLQMLRESVQVIKKFWK